MPASQALAIMPTYNNAADVALAVALTCVYVPVLVVDDDSADDTMLRAEAAGATVLLQVPGQGREAALRKGFRWALARGYTVVLTLTADRRCVPQSIPSFLERYETRQADLIIGVQHQGALPWWYRVRRLVWLWGLSWAMGQRIYEYGCGYQLISQRLLERILQTPGNGLCIEHLIPVVCLQQAWTLDWIHLPASDAQPISTYGTGFAPQCGTLLHTIWHIRHLMHHQ
ncbi:MAG: glycosyltransferase [Anaerolineae bacterium]|nr:glycosyltransferase [Anaerolineae bacterium]